MKNKRDAMKEVTRTFNNKITFEELVTTVNPNGFEVSDWVEVISVWAAVSNLHGREYYAAAAVQAENTVKFTIRYIPGIDTKQRIMFQGKTHNITAIDNIRYEDRLIEIKAIEVEQSV